MRREKTEQDDIVDMMTFVFRTTLINIGLGALNWISLYYWGWSWLWFLTTVIVYPIVHCEVGLQSRDGIEYFIKAYTTKSLSKVEKVFRTLWTLNVSYWLFTICFWLYQILANLGNINLNCEG